MRKRKTILVAPLHWGLGHATRCIPIIHALLASNYNVLLASDGAALWLLQKEFPQLESIELASYNITYAKNGKNFKWSLFLKLPQIQQTIASEKKQIKKLVAAGKIDGIISDNRFGVRSKKVPSVFITHQLNVLTGNTTLLSSTMHQKIIHKFNQCWVPDLEGEENLSGRLGHVKNKSLNTKYIGPLSRMKKQNLPVVYDVLALLSGPEPQRTMLEEKLLEEFIDTDLKVLLVQGLVEVEKTTKKIHNITVINFLQSSDLEIAISESEVIVCRSGYTTIMDLVALEKKAFFIPTPGQYEQEYLAQRFDALQFVPSATQEGFTVEKLKEVTRYKGLMPFKYQQDLNSLFRLFEGK